MSRLEELASLVAIVEAGSLRAAAERLGVSRSQVSRRLGALEERLGTPLLRRTTRSRSLTDEGRLLYERVAPLLGDLEECEQEVRAQRGQVRGRLRVAAPLSFGVGWLAPLVAELAATHPELELEVRYSDRLVDLVGEGFDVAVRVGVLPDSSLRAVRVAPVELLACASPAYLRERGRPEHPSELAGHACLRYLGQADPAWSFVPEQAADPQAEAIRLRVEERFRADNGEALREGALRGLGIALLPDFLLCDALRSGALVRLFVGWRSWERAAVWLLTPPGRERSARVRRFREVVIERFGGDPPWRAEAGRGGPKGNAPRDLS